MRSRDPQAHFLTADIATPGAICETFYTLFLNILRVETILIRNMQGIER